MSDPVIGPIPAYAGETESGPGRFAAPGAYPRIRGGNRGFAREPVGGAGLSPHTRGKLFALATEFSAIGPIPAYAGETP